MAKTRIAVLFGGMTKDHKVSLMSAYSLLKEIPREKYDVTPIGITRSGRWLYFPGDYEEIKNGTWEMNGDCCSAIISPDPLHSGIITIMSDGSTAMKRIEAVISVLHGKYGECGRIQGLLKLSKIPYTDCEPETAAYCMDKAMTHLILSSAGIEVPKYVLLERSDMNIIDERIAEAERVLSYPMYISASSCSSSIGANIVHNAEEMKAAVKIAFSHHHTVIAEEELGGRTIECGVYGNSYDVQTTVLGETVKTYGINSAAEYTAEYITCPELTHAEEFAIKAAAIKAFRVMSFKGSAKMSFRLCEGRALLKRISPIPGMSEDSAFPMMMNASGHDYGKMIDRMISFALETD